MNEPMRLLTRSRGAQLALLDASGLCEYYSGEAETLVGSVYLGVVERVLTEVGAAFVRLGLTRNGFLPFRESDSFQQFMGSAPLITGRECIVQVKKDPKGEKGAFLTRDIALPGQYVLLMPNNRFVGVSKRVEDPDEREWAYALGKSLGDCGVIVRHAALFASRDEICAETEALLTRWHGIVKDAETRKAPARLYAEPGMLNVLARDYAARHTLEVYADAPEGQATELPWHTLNAAEMDALWHGAGVEEALKQALGRRVPLPGGGSLIIDEREALQTIDVNSGSAVFAAAGSELAFERNMAAVAPIARQIRLRNLSGIILIDFIDMRTDEERGRVLSALEDALADDRVKSVVHGFTSLGLLEMTRKRTGESLRERITDPCTACGESGRIRR